ncbi:Gp49 family protein [Phyllobacterium sp. LjRoot231]|uniref:Gp49 family protein n=1 Tax=Phyllobacterium sp. LjRoot231 TaxID=3342289 RepID=UPI003ECE32D6
MGSLEVSDAESAAVQKTANRVSLDSMKEKIDQVSFLNPPIHPTMTICVMQLKNGFVLVGKSAPADSENFNEELGRKFAEEDCIRQMWPLEGYALRERLSATE